MNRRSARNAQSLYTTNEHYWNLPGTLENWGTGIERKVWGLRPHFESTWKRLRPGDVLFFYVAAPVGGVVGYGRVVTAFPGNEPLWPDEIARSKVIYPYRFEFQVDRALDAERWIRDRVPARDLGVVVQSIGRIPADVASKLMVRITAAWGPAVTGASSTAERPPSRHDEMKRLLLDVGRMRRFVCHEEYRIDGERLDVVWKRVEKSVPTFAFEVQVGGDIYHAIGKLKHAYDIWNSKICLVTDAGNARRAQELLRGTFHEIADALRILQVEKLERLRQALADVHTLEEELGFR